MILRTHKKMERSILTAGGKISFSRYVLRPVDDKSRQRLLDLTGEATVIPLDDALQTDRIPFKMTVSMMLDVAYYGAVCGSYEETEEILARIYGCRIGDDTVRHVTNFIGKIVLEEDLKAAEENMQFLESGALSFPADKEGVLYLKVGSAPVITRNRDKEGSACREVKYGYAFSSDHMRSNSSADGEYHHEILKSEWISSMGDASEFKKLIFSLTLRNGYGRYKETVLISDGSDWIKDIREELFSDARLILDYACLRENTSRFAAYVFNNDAKNAEKWSDRICDLLKEGCTDDVLRELEVYRELQVPQGIVNLYAYIDDNKEFMDYPSCLSNGVFIGQQCIETSDKKILPERINRSGKRWNPETAQYLLALKAKEESGLWWSYVVPVVNKIMSQ